MKNHFQGFGRQLIGFTRRQFVLMLLGNMVLALGLAMFNMTGSNHPFHTMLYGAEALIGRSFFSYANLQILLNIVLVVVEIIFGLKYIGIGAIVNMFLLGYAITFFTWLLNLMHLPSVIDWPQAIATGFAGITAGNLVCHLIVLAAATLVISLGLSLYQAGDMGVAPYDSMPLIVAGRTKIPFFWCRIGADAICFVVTLLVGGSFGLGTIVTVFCTGPFIRFFDKRVSGKLVKTA